MLGHIRDRNQLLSEGPTSHGEGPGMPATHSSNNVSEPRRQSLTGGGRAAKVVSQYKGMNKSHKQQHMMEQHLETFLPDSGTKGQFAVTDPAMNQLLGCVRVCECVCHAVRDQPLAKGHHGPTESHPGRPGTSGTTFRQDEKQSPPPDHTGSQEPTPGDWKAVTNS